MTHTDERPVFDARDADILAQRVADWNAKPGPRVGDFAILANGKTVRFSHDWGDSLQTTDGRFGASFYLGKGGYMDFSGGLDPSIPKVAFVYTGEVRDGQAWFFHHEETRAHNGVYFNVPCRVFRQTSAINGTP